MAKKKSHPETGTQPESKRLKNIVVLRGTDEWRDWLHGLAEANNAPITVTIDQALKEMSDKLKHRRPPKRTP
jgi:hypothetical protein